MQTETTRGWRWRPRLGLPALVAMGMALAGPARPQATVASGRAGAAAAPRVSESGRPFDHRWHERVSCARCHGTGPRHRAILVRTPADCASCHHDPALGRTCAGCHRDKVHRPGAAATARLVTAAGVRRPFDHRWHGGVACTECHRAALLERVMLVPAPRDCGNCHHAETRGRSCVDCHENKAPGAATAGRAVVVSGMKRPFEHRRHERVDCRACHGAGARDGPMAVPTRAECASCHHHGPFAKRCVACHRITGPEGGVRTGLRGDGAPARKQGGEER